MAGARARARRARSAPRERRRPTPPARPASARQARSQRLGEQLYPLYFPEFFEKPSETEFDDSPGPREEEVAQLCEYERERNQNILDNQARAPPEAHGYRKSVPH